MARVAELEHLFGPSETEVAETDWSSIENRLGVVFPSDYKEWAIRYPALYVDRFMRILHPENFFALKSREGIADEISGLSDLDPMSRDVVYDANGGLIGNDLEMPSFYPENDGLVPWGNTDNGDLLMWRTVGDSRNWEIVVADGEGVIWQEFDCGFSDFLVSLFRGEFTMKILDMPINPAIQVRRIIAASDGEVGKPTWVETAKWSDYFRIRRLNTE